MNTRWSCTLIAVTLLAMSGSIKISTNVRADDAPGLMPIHSATPASRVKPSAATSNVPVISPGEITATPEMWFYEQALRRYDDPKNAVRAVAESKANERRARIAAMQWYGYSNLRPASGIDPVDGPLQAQWIGNGYNPNNWIAPARPAGWAIPGIATGY
jgi:hypothetical protein